MTDRRLDDLGGLLMGWCGVFALLGYGQDGASPRRRLASIVIGAALLMLARLMDGERKRNGSFLV